MTDAAAPAPRVKRQRGLTELLLTIVLTLDIAMVFFASLVIFGLDRFEPDWLALVFGGVVIVVLAALVRVQRYPWGVWAGAAAQASLIGIGFIEPMGFVLGGAFAALWLYCFVRARQIEAQKAAWLAAHAEAAAEAVAPTPDPASASGPTPTEGETP